MSVVADDIPDRAAAAADRATDDAEGELALLFSRLADGDGRALERVYDCAGRSLFGLALWHTGSRDDAAEVVQEVFVRLARERGRLAAVRHPRAWLLTVARRLAIDAARRRSRIAAETPEALLLEAPAEDPARSVDAARASALLRRLPARQRDAVYLRHFEELSFAEIGRVTGVPTFTAASRYRLGIGRLRALMEDAR